MITIIHEEDENKKIRCPHCTILLQFSIDEVYSTYKRGLELSHSKGWLDCDGLWHYIKCPRCNKYINVNTNLSKDNKLYLQLKYERNHN